MDGSNGIFIVMPIVALIILLILVGLPYLGDRQSDPRHSRGGRSLGHQAHGHLAAAGGGQVLAAFHKNRPLIAG